MYIALKWLVSLSVGMWFAMCFTDLIIKQSKRSLNEVQYTSKGTLNPLVNQFSNVTQVKYKKLPTKSKYTNKLQSTNVLHMLTFMAGALVVSVFNRKKEIVKFAKQTIQFDIKRFHQWQKKIEFAAIILGAAIEKHCASLWEKMTKIYRTYKDILEQMKYLKQNEVLNKLIDKLKHSEEEQNNLNQLLIAAIHENENIRMRFALEVMAKNRLAQHIEDVQKQIREHRSRYNSFQQLYLVTHQENIFLKNRIRKLAQEKVVTEKNLMSLINEIYKSSNNELKAYCDRTVTKKRDDKIGADVNAIIEKFLEKSRNNFARSVDLKRKDSFSPRINEIIQNNNFVSTKSLPRLKGLPGEYVWTVKDKNGIIEKLYEFESESDYDNSETIRRIRQYSVYFDKDCILDFKRSLPESECRPSTSGYTLLNKYPVTSKRIVTGSQAFQNFLKNNKSLVTSNQTVTVL